MKADCPEDPDFSVMFAGSRLAVLAWKGEAFRCIYANPAAQAMLGCDPAGQKAAEIDGLEAFVEDLSAVRSTGAAIDAERRLRSEGLAARSLHHDAQPWTAPDGGAGGVLSILAPVRRATDTSDASDAEMRDLFRRLLDASPEFIGISDADFLPVYGNPAALGMVEMEIEDVLETPVANYFVEEERDFVRDTVIPTLHRDGIWRGELHLVGAKTGRRIPILYTNFRVETPGGKDFYATITRDLTAEKAAEAKQALLMHELDHRVKNILTVVQSVARRTFGRSGKAEVETFSDRLQALAGAHRALAAGEWESGDLAELAPTILRGAGAPGARLSLDGPSVRLSSSMIQAVALTLHELCTNAIKHGAFSNDAGRVSVAWSVSPGTKDEPDHVTLTWTESGGPPVIAPSGDAGGFGSVLIQRSVAAEDGGSVSLDYRKDGLVCLLEGPVA